MKIISRKSIVRVLTKNGFMKEGKKKTSHQKYTKRNDGQVATTILTDDKDYHVRTIHMISKQTGIPIDVFMRNSGSKKYKNGNGNVFSLYG